MKPTQGPWRVEESQLHPSSEKTGYTIVTDAFDVVSGHLAIRRQADAALIAAAPAMLEVLEEVEECSRYWSEYDVPLGLHDRIKAAIAKARGENV